MKEDSDTKTEKKEDKKTSDKSRTSKFMDKLDFAQIHQYENEHNVKKEQESSKSEEDPDHLFPTLSEVLGPERINEIKSGKSKLLVGIGIIVGLLFVIFGGIMMIGSADRVADNVVFGEREVFSVFLILIGVLIMACTLAYKYFGKSFLKGIDKDIESYDKVSSNSKKTNKKG